MSLSNLFPHTHTGTHSLSLSLSLSLSIYIYIYIHTYIYLVHVTTFSIFPLFASFTNQIRPKATTIDLNPHLQSEAITVEKATTTG